MSAVAKTPFDPAVRKRTVPVLPVRDNVHFPALINTLLVGRDVSVKALQSAMRRDRSVLVVGQREVTIDEPRADDLYRFGTLSEILQVLPMPDGTMRVVLRGSFRASVDKFVFRRGYIQAECSEVFEYGSTSRNVEATMREALDVFHEIANLGRQLPPEAIESLPPLEDPGHLSDVIAHHLNLRPAIKQELLEDPNVESRLEILLRTLVNERQLLELQTHIRNQVEQELGNTQREYFLREQLKAIQHELRAPAELSEEGEEYAALIARADMPPETQEKAMQELRRLEKAPSSSPENMVIRNYLDWLLALPWNVLSDDRIDVKAAAKILDRDHYGLDKVKDRILDFLAVRQLNPSLRGPILCFAGPPGVGKTSIGRSIAEALGRKFVRVSVGGVRDEAEIRGHRRTYIGSMPGRLIQSIRQCGTRNPVLMLDEIDKMGMDMRGDPTSALLEALDPEQNRAFSDHYIEAPFDLSSVMFILTANLLEGIPPALRDRMEIIRFPSFTEAEKLNIADKYLVQKSRAEHGLAKEQFKIDSDALQTLIREYTREAGVRGLEREIATLCRKAARRIAEGRGKRVRVAPDDLKALVGGPRYRYGSVSAADEVGASTGLVYTEFGGDVITIEASLVAPMSDEPKVILTGSLGEVMRESALAAITYLRSQASRWQPEGKFDFDVHIHVPEGAVPKDGPSAGVAMAVALASAYSGRPVRCNVAMTGEITLRGKVLPVGGIREKILAAHRAGIKFVLLPRDNERDLEDLPISVREELEFHLIDHADQALGVALATDQLS